MSRYRPLIVFLSLLTLYSVLVLVKTYKVGPLLNKENILTCYDCYYYARISEDYYKGSEEVKKNFSKLMNVPDGSGYFQSFYGLPPLISFLATKISKIFGIELNKLFLLLPPLLSPLLVFSLYLWIREFGHPLVFLGGALYGVLNLEFILRTQPGRFDTDMLIPFFLFLLLFLVERVAKERELKRSLIYAIILGLCMQIFLWHYFKPVFVFIYLYSLAAALILYKRKVKEIFILLGIYLVFSLPALSIQAIKGIIDQYLLERIFREAVGFLPYNFAQSVNELQKVDFNHFVLYTTNSKISAIILLICLPLFFVKFWRQSLIALPLILIGLSTFPAGRRHLIYLSPFLGLGVGTALYLIYLKVKPYLGKYKPLKLIYFTLSLLIMLFLFYSDITFNFLRRTPSPVINDAFYNYLKEIKKITPKNSYIWTWWDYGYIIEKVSRRGTYIDNGGKHPAKLFAVAQSLMTPDEEYAYKLISLISNNSVSFYYKDGMRADDFIPIVKSYKEPLKKEVYLMITPNLYAIPYIAQLGSYKQFKRPPLSYGFRLCGFTGGALNCGDFLLRGNRITFFRPYPVYEVVLIDYKTGKKEVLYKNEGGILLFTLFKLSPNLYVYLPATKGFEKTLLYRVITQKLKHFKKVYDRFPLLVLYRVQ